MPPFISGRHVKKESNQLKSSVTAISMYFSGKLIVTIWWTAKENVILIGKLCKGPKLCNQTRKRSHWPSICNWPNKWYIRSSFISHITETFTVKRLSHWLVIKMILFSLTAAYVQLAHHPRVTPTRSYCRSSRSWRSQRDSFQIAARIKLHLDSVQRRTWCLEK